MAGGRLFAVVRTRGARWDPACALEEQADSRGHPDLMNALARGGFVVRGGPLDGTPDVLLIVRAESPPCSPTASPEIPGAGRTCFA